MSNSKQHQESISALYERNYDAVIDYNSKIFPTLMLIASFLMVFTTLFGALSYFGIGRFDFFGVRLPFYFVCMVISLLLYFVSRMSSMKKYIIPLMYLGFAEIFVFAIVLSVVASPDQRATIIMGSFCLMPMCCVDKHWRTALFIMFFYVLHTVLSFIYKGGDTGIADAINCFVFVFFGLFVGRAFVRIKLESFETQRLLIIEKQTDVLTGIQNRRKLEESLEKSDKPNFIHPAGILMMDVDKFKEYNDRFGHAAGDNCLRQLGRTMLEFEQRYPMVFFRYGGEEFVAFVYSCDEARLLKIAEELRSTVASEKLGSGVVPITMSIGAALCRPGSGISCERWIDLADKASYKAKELGRNRVVALSQLEEAADIYKKD